MEEKSLASQLTEKTKLVVELREHIKELRRTQLEIIRVEELLKQSTPPQ